MKPPPFEYHRPGSVKEAVALLGRLDNAKVLAGGQSLMAMLNLRYVHPDHVVDINRIPELDFVEVKDGRLRIGAMTRQRRVETDAEVMRRTPILVEALKQVGHRQTRNHGTIGGSLCHLDPAAELPAVALLYGATLRVEGPKGGRSIPMKDFMAGYMTPALDAGELLTAVEFPLWTEPHGHAFVEFSRRHGDFAVASAACLLQVDKAGKIAKAAVAVGGVETLPVRLTAAETLLVGKSGSPDLFDQAGALCEKLDALVDVHADQAYRRRVASAVVRRALAAAFERAT
jgi:carbon-monoxide dehydrogenase medium subunit